MGYVSFVVVLSNRDPGRHRGMHATGNGSKKGDRGIEYSCDTMSAIVECMLTTPGGR